MWFGGCALTGDPSLSVVKGPYQAIFGYGYLEDEEVSEPDFPKTLRTLETGLGLFGYYRKFVPRFSSIE